MFRTDRLERPNSRRALMVAGVVTVAFSLIVSIAPAMAAKGGNSNGSNGNGNAGVAKIHDATTDLEAGEQANEPWVCAFWVGFYASNPTEAGTWQVLSWPPTGDGTVVASGTYDTTGDGVDATGEVALADGHYRLDVADRPATTTRSTRLSGSRARPRIPTRAMRRRAMRRRRR